MSPETRELNIESVLADPMIRIMMKADRVIPADLEALLRGKARVVAPSRAPIVPASLLACTARAVASGRACFA